MSRYAIFGDSFISRLQAFTHDRLDFERPHRFFGVPGMSTRNKISRKFDEMISYRPRFVFINIGGNDITANCDSHIIFQNIVNLTEELYETGVECVFVASIVERGNFKHWTGLDRKTFNTLRRSINNKLKKYFGKNFIQVGKRLQFPRHYDNDLIHPGNKQGGMKILKYEVLKTFRKTL